MAAPQIDQKAKIIVDGQEYEFWTSVIAERTVQVIPSTVTLQTYESSPGGLPGGWRTAHLMLGQKAECYLADQLALTGWIDVRQVLYNKDIHEVTIRVGSNVTSMLAGTTDPKIDGEGGQFIGKDFEHILKEIGRNVEVNTEMQHAIGADLPFDRVQVPIGQTRMDFMAPLAAMRNLTAIDDETGKLIYSRPAEDGKSSEFSLVEGKNILEARAIMRNDLAVNEAKSEGQSEGSNETWAAEAAQVEGVAYNRNYKGPKRPFVQVLPLPGKQADAKMHAAHMMSINALQEFSIDITVQGWLAPDGKIWFYHLQESIDVYSPMILPLGSDYATLYINGARHIQSSESGTITTLSLCLPDALGASGTLLAQQRAFPDGGGG